MTFHSCILNRLYLYSIQDYKAGFTPLHHLVQLGDISLVEDFIVEFRPDIDALSYAGVTPLHLACCIDLEPIADLLILEGADPMRESMEGLSWTNVVQLRHNVSLAFVLKGSFK